MLADIRYVTAVCDVGGKLARQPGTELQWLDMFEPGRVRGVCVCVCLCVSVCVYVVWTGHCNICVSVNMSLLSV